jgi:hypothetical protein
LGNPWVFSSTTGNAASMVESIGNSFVNSKGVDGRICWLFRHRSRRAFQQKTKDFGNSHSRAARSGVVCPMRRERGAARRHDRAVLLLGVVGGSRFYG